MNRERLEALSTAELEGLRSEIDLLLAQRRVSGGSERGSGGGSGREVLEERSTEHGTLRREVSAGADGPAGEPNWYLYYYANTKTGKRRLISENLGPELPPQYRD